MIDAISLQRIDTLHPRLIAEAKAILGEAQAAMPASVQDNRFHHRGQIIQWTLTYLNAELNLN